jgi:DNA-directed RNA polymerase specialized sigma24 family protein
VTRFYIRNEDILPYIIDYRATGKISNELGSILLKIAENLASKGSFHGYTWREDMVMDSVFTCIRYLHNFDPIRYEKPNPFAYFTSIIKNSFLNYIRKQKKHSEIKDWCYNHHQMLNETCEVDGYSERAIDYSVMKEGQ